MTADAKATRPGLVRLKNLGQIHVQTPYSCTTSAVVFRRTIEAAQNSMASLGWNTESTLLPKKAKKIKRIYEKD